MTCLETPSSEIKITINNGLIIPTTGTLTKESKDEYTIFSIFCYTYNPDMTILLKINKSLIDEAYDGDEYDFFNPIKEEGFEVNVLGKVLENKDNINYLSILVTNITVKPFPVNIPKELQKQLGITQGRRIIRKDVEGKNSKYSSDSNSKMEISSMLLDTTLIDSDNKSNDNDNSLGYDFDQMEVENFHEKMNSLSKRMYGSSIETAEEPVKEDEHENTIVVETVDIVTTEQQMNQTSFSPVGSTNQSDQLPSPQKPTLPFNNLNQISLMQDLEYITQSQNQQMVPFKVKNIKKRSTKLKSLRRSPRLALKKRIQYFPIRRKYNRRMITASS